MVFIFLIMLLIVIILYVIKSILSHIRDVFLDLGWYFCWFLSFRSLRILLACSSILIIFFILLLLFQRDIPPISPKLLTQILIYITLFSIIVSNYHFIKFQQKRYEYGLTKYLIFLWNLNLLTFDQSINIKFGI